MENTDQDEKQKQLKKMGDYLLVGFMLIGTGIGFYFGRIPIGVLIGLGIGFVLKAVAIASFNAGKK